MKIQTILTGAISAVALALAAAPVQAATEVFNFADNADGIFAVGTLFVADSPNKNGTFDIQGIIGSVTNATDPSNVKVDDILGLVSSPNQPDPTDNYGFIYDNVLPLNINGVLFSGDSSAIYNLWSTGGKTGEFYTYGIPGVANFDAHGTLSVGSVPEPATWAMMLVGFGGLGGALRAARRRRGTALVAA